MTKPAVEDYADADAYLDALREYAWDDQDRVVKSSRGGMVLHIPDGVGGVVCWKSPRASSPSPLGTFPEGEWRECVEWCRDCLSGVYVHDGDDKPGNPDGFVVSTAKRTHDLDVYHSRECYTYPDEVREASPAEVERLEECGACRMTPREGVPE